MTPDQADLPAALLPRARSPTAAADYDVVRRAIAHIRGNWRAQPEIEQVARAAGVSPPTCTICSAAGAG